MIPESFKQEVLSRVDIVDVIDARVPLKKAGANYSARCPFHTEKSPSFTVSPSKQFYHCFGCGAHGNAISFLMEYGGLGYVDAVRDLAESVGLRLPAYDGPGRAQPAREGPDLTELMARAQAHYKEMLKATPRAIEYLKGRGLTGRIAARYGIGYAPDAWQGLQTVFTHYDEPALVECGLVIVNDEGRRYDRFRDRIMFPILNQRGLVIGFGGRVLDRGEPKYLNSPETPLFEKGRELYGLPQAREAIRASGRAMVVEGYMDVVALAQHGVENAVATLGTATTATHLLKLLRQTNEIVFCFDGDKAGRKAAWHALEVALGCVPDGKLLRFLFLPAEHDPDSFVREEGHAAFSALAESAQPLSGYLIEELERRNDTTTPEGRSKLLHDARPLVESMTAPGLKIQILRELARVGGVTADELGELYDRVGGQGRPAAGERAPSAPFRREGANWPRRDGPGAGFRQPRPAGTERTRLAADARLEREVLRALLADPRLARRVPIELLADERPETAALQAVIDALDDIVDAVPSATPADAASSVSAAPDEEGVEDRPPAAPSSAVAALVIERFRGTPHEEFVSACFADVLLYDWSPEAAHAQLRGALLQLEIRQLQSRLRALNEQAAGGVLSEADKASYAQLIRRERELKDALPGGAAAPM